MRLRKLRKPSPVSSILLIAMVILLPQSCPLAFAQSPSAPAASGEPGPAPGHATQQQLQQLVSPIALYPDMLVAMILTGSTYPTQVVEADRWLQDHKNLKGQQLTDAVNTQPWDPSIKSLVQYPPVLDNMNQNLSWTSALGQAYYNQPSDVMKAIQTLRNLAQKAGTLKSGPQQTVKVEPAGSTTTTVAGSAGQQIIVIEPTQPQVVYVPQYNPTTAYGQPMAAPPGYSSADLLMTGLMSFGLGMMVGSMMGSDWGCNWHGGNVTYNKNIYVSNSHYVPSRWGYANHPWDSNHPYYGYHGEYPRPYNSYSQYGQHSLEEQHQYNETHPYNEQHEMAEQYQYNQSHPNDQQHVMQEQHQYNQEHGYTEPNMPKTYDSPQYQSKGNYTPTSSGRNWNQNHDTGFNRSQNSFRGYGDQSSQHSWGKMGNYEPGGFAQASSARGHDSYSGENRRWGGGGGDRRFK